MLLCADKRAASWDYHRRAWSQERHSEDRGDSKDPVNPIYEGGTHFRQNGCLLQEIHTLFSCNSCALCTQTLRGKEVWMGCGKERGVQSPYECDEGTTFVGFPGLWVLVRRRDGRIAHRPRRTASVQEGERKYTPCLVRESDHYGHRALIHRGREGMFSRHIRVEKVSCTTTVHAPIHAHLGSWHAAICVPEEGHLRSVGEMDVLHHSRVLFRNHAQKGESKPLPWLFAEVWGRGE